MPRLGTSAAPSLKDRVVDSCSTCTGLSAHLKESPKFLLFGFTALVLSLSRFYMAGGPNDCLYGPFVNSLWPMGFSLLLALDALFTFVYADALPVKPSAKVEPAKPSQPASGMEQAGMGGLASFQQAGMGGLASDDPRELALTCAMLKVARLVFDCIVPFVAVMIGMADLMVSTEKLYNLIGRDRCTLRQDRATSAWLSDDKVYHLPGIGKAVLVMDINVTIGMWMGVMDPWSPLWQAWALFVLAAYVYATKFMLTCPSGIGYGVVTAAGLVGISLNSAQAILVRVVALGLGAFTGYLLRMHRQNGGSGTAPFLPVNGSKASGGGPALGNGWGAGQSLGGDRAKGNLADLRKNLLEGS